MENKIINIIPIPPEIKKYQRYFHIVSTLYNSGYNAVATLGLLHRNNKIDIPFKDFMEIIYYLDQTNNIDYGINKTKIKNVSKGSNGKKYTEEFIKRAVELAKVKGLRKAAREIAKIRGGNTTEKAIIGLIQRNTERGVVKMIKINKKK